jgi:2-polyprenyl-6-methoxyphenol hydroxylase-like FAD-dependent oxidoreductase
MSKIVVIGAGLMGLAAAYQALADGHEVDIIESSLNLEEWLDDSSISNDRVRISRSPRIAPRKRACGLR